jgi:hypothetical protein
MLRTEIGHHVAELCRRDVAISVLVKDLERLLDLLLRVGIPHLTSHHRQELGSGSVTIPLRSKEG